MKCSRRGLFQAGAATSVLCLGAGSVQAQAKRREISIRVGAMDGVLGGGGPKALTVAKAIGIEGVEAAAGKAEDRLTITRPEVIAEYQRVSQETGVVVSSICMGVLNGSPLISEPRAPGWISATIDAAHALKAKNILIACFGRGALNTRDKQEKAASILKELAPQAAAKGVTLGLENTLSADDNLFILEKARHPQGLKIYYDVGNSTGNGYDVPTEIRDLNDAICQIHFKDRKSSLLGQGEVQIPPILDAIVENNYSGWITLETSSKGMSKDIAAAANAGFVRGLFAPYMGV
jgi:L-ribulose-5-phosphate 3-epimerase